MFVSRTLAGVLYWLVMTFKFSFFFFSSHSRILKVGCCYSGLTVQWWNYGLVILSFLTFYFKLIASWSPDGCCISIHPTTVQRRKNYLLLNSYMFVLGGAVDFPENVWNIFANILPTTGKYVCTNSKKNLRNCRLIVIFGLVIYIVSSFIQNFEQEDRKEVYWVGNY